MKIAYTVMDKRERRTEAVSVRFTPAEVEALDRFVRVGELGGRSEAVRELCNPYVMALEKVESGEALFFAATAATKEMFKLNQRLALIERNAQEERAARDQGLLELPEVTV